MTPEEARTIWYGEVPEDDDEEHLLRALEAGSVLGYIKREWDPDKLCYENSLTPLGRIAAEQHNKARRKHRRGFHRRQ